jgi:diacylglycerol kinase family enzyme
MADTIVHPCEYYFIVNPIAGRGAGALAIPQLDALVRRLQLDYELVRTETPRHATQLARQAAAAGCRVVVAVGGDGTANGVLNGLLQAASKARARPPWGSSRLGGAMTTPRAWGCSPAHRLTWKQA